MRSKLVASTWSLEQKCKFINTVEDTVTPQLHKNRHRKRHAASVVHNTDQTERPV
jgi:hypothetical protein